MKVCVLNGYFSYFRIWISLADASFEIRGRKHEIRSFENNYLRKVNPRIFKNGLHS